MHNSYQIEYLTRDKIDINKWDECVNKASNGVIYARSIYLDKVCTNWDALVINNYELVMPLPWRKKLGFMYVYTPYFISYLGLFGNNISSELIHDCFKQIKRRFHFCDLSLNEQTPVASVKEFNLIKRKNLLISLTQSYEALYNNYNRLAKRKINAASKNNLGVHYNVDAAVVIDEYEKNYEHRKRIVPHRAYTDLKNLLAHLPSENYRTYSVKKEDTLLAFYLVLVDEKNVYSLLGGSTTEGKKYGAFYLATTTAIKDFAATGKTFRFEGSDIEGIAFFNLQFSAYPISYYRLKINNLPWPLRHFKE
jgi:hypothetical protein